MKLQTQLKLALTKDLDLATTMTTGHTAYILFQV